MSNDQPMDDEAFARKLQEELNAEVSSTTSSNDSKTSISKEEQLKLDLEFAQKLMEEEDKFDGGKNASTTKNERDKKEDTSIKKKQQEELDHILALKMQEGLYQQENSFQNKPPPLPVQYSPYPAAPLFQKQKRDEHAPPTSEAVKRITSDLKEVLLTKGNNGIYVVPDEEDIMHIQALIIGPTDTPYANGFFHFDMLFPHDYPWRPPKVQLITTDGGVCRFNPNLYANGKVCLSILGTWQGPGWSQVQTMLSTLLSIQSLMNPKPYHNEPGYEHERKPGDAEKYNQVITHETLRVAVVGMLENPTCGNLFEDIMETEFLKRYKEYETICVNLKDVFDGKSMEDPFGEKRGVYRYGQILKKLEVLKIKLEAKQSEKETQPSLEVIQKDNVNNTTTTTATSTNENNDSMEVDTSGTKQTPSSSSTSTTSTIEPKSPMDTEQVATPFVMAPVVSPTTTLPALALASTSPIPTSSSISTTDTKTGTLSIVEELTKKIQLSVQPQPEKKFDPDEEFARKLQEEELGITPQKPYNSYGGYSNSYGGYNSYSSEYGESTYSKNYTPVKPPSISELLKESSEPKEKEQEKDSIVCLVCHQSPKEYIILPSCQAPHVYCMGCASKMVKQATNMKASSRWSSHYSSKKHNKRSSSGQSIQCVLCASVSTLDPVGGLNSLRRKKRKYDNLQKSDKCAEHGEEFGLFCTDCYELICFLCAIGSHSRHNIEALDVAFTKVQLDIEKQMSVLEQKRAKLEEFVQEVKSSKEQISINAANAQKDAKEKMAQLRKLLDEKDKEIDESIKRMESSKLNAVQIELTKAQQRIETIDSSISTVSGALKENNALGFLQKVEEVEEGLRHSAMSTDPKVKKKWFTLPQLHTQHQEATLKVLKYKEHKGAPGYAGYMLNGIDYEEYSDEDISPDESVAEEY